MSVEERAEIADIILEIEMAEEHLMDAATIWKALTRHLNGRGLGNDQADDESLTRAQYWSARSYLTSWLACRRGENLPRMAVVRQILRMWETCPGLKLSTQALCRARFRLDELEALSDVQLRAALWMTIADWQAYWANR